MRLRSHSQADPPFVGILWARSGAVEHRTRHSAHPLLHLRTRGRCSWAKADMVGTAGAAGLSAAVMGAEGDASTSSDVSTDMSVPLTQQVNANVRTPGLDTVMIRHLNAASDLSNRLDDTVVRQDASAISEIQTVSDLSESRWLDVLSYSQVCTRSRAASALAVASAHACRGTLVASELIIHMSDLQGRHGRP